jgi:hypothetical protein
MTAKVVCATCAQIPAGDAGACDSIDCPTLYSRVKIDREYEDAAQLCADVLKIASKQQKTSIEIV